MAIVLEGSIFKREEASTSINESLDRMLWWSALKHFQRSKPNESRQNHTQSTVLEQSNVIGANRKLENVLNYQRSIIVCKSQSIKLNFIFV